MIGARQRRLRGGRGTAFRQTHCYVKVDIYFTAVGRIDIPTAKKIVVMMEEIRENPQSFKFVA